MRKTKLSYGYIVINIFLIFVCLAAIVPLFLIVSASFTDDIALTLKGYSLIPSKPSLSAYEFILGDPQQLIYSYLVSIIVAFGGAFTSLIVISLLAYPMSRPEFKYRNALSLFVFFTMLFNGGIVASYIINTRYLGLSNSIFALILPYLVIPFYVLLLRTYFLGIPRELTEAARIDGANEWMIFIKIILPLSTSALATIGLFSLLLYWNDYYLALLYIDNPTITPLQLLLFRILNNITYLTTNPNVSSGVSNVARAPVESARMALAVLATGPMVFVFLLFQRFFVRGITMGSVKG